MSQGYHITLHTNKNRPHQQNINRLDTSRDIFQDSELIQQSDSESIIIGGTYQKIQLHDSSEVTNSIKTQRKDASTDGQYKQSIRSIKQKKKIIENKTIISQKEMQDSVLLEDQQQKLKSQSQILAHYKLGEDQQIFQIDVKKEKNQNMQKNQNIDREIEPHWAPVQIPDNLFDDQQSKSIKVKNNKNASKSLPIKQVKKISDHKKQNKKQQNAIKNQNLLNPFTFVKAIRQQQNLGSFSCHPNNNPKQNSPNLNFQPLNLPFSPFLPMQQPQFNQNFPQMPFPQNGNFMPPVSPRSQGFWPQNPPLRQLPQQFFDQPNSYGGIQLINQMRYLRQQVKMLRQSISFDRNQRQFHSHLKRQNSSDLNKFEKVVEQMKKTIESQRQQHRKQLQELSKKFIDEIIRLRESNYSLENQNRTLKSISEISLKHVRHQSQKNEPNLINKNNHKKSVRKLKDIDDILDKKIYGCLETQQNSSRTMLKSRQMTPRIKKQTMSKKKKQSVKKSS